MHRTIRSVALTTLVLFGAACGSDTGPNDPPPLANGTMTARIDGSAWRASITIVATYQGGILAVAGGDPVSGGTRTIGFAAVVAAPGTFPIGGTGPANGLVTIGSSTWQAAAGTGSGSITVTAISATGARGTFQFNALPVAGTPATGTRAITEGSFDVTF